IQRFMAARMLVAPDSEDARRITATFMRGEKIGDFRVLECIQALEDTELYRIDAGAGSQAALKIVRSRHAQAMQQTFEREATILRHLDGQANAKLIATGQINGCSYLATEWCGGLPAAIAAKRLRKNTSHRRDELLRLCVAILDAYAHL